MSASRRSVLKSALGVGIGSFGILHWFRADAAEYNYKLAHDQPIAHPQNIRIIEAAKQIREDSGGRLAIQVYSEQSARQRHADASLNCAPAPSR